MDGSDRQLDVGQPRQTEGVSSVREIHRDRPEMAPALKRFLTTATSPEGLRMDTEHAARLFQDTLTWTESNHPDRRIFPSARSRVQQVADQLRRNPRHDPSVSPVDPEVINAVTHFTQYNHHPNRYGLDPRNPNAYYTGLIHAFEQVLNTKKGSEETVDPDLEILGKPKELNVSLIKDGHIVEDDSEIARRKKLEQAFKSNISYFSQNSVYALIEPITLSPFTKFGNQDVRITLGGYFTNQPGFYSLETIVNTQDAYSLLGNIFIGNETAEDVLKLLYWNAGISSDQVPTQFNINPHINSDERIATHGFSLTPGRIRDAVRRELFSREAERQKSLRDQRGPMIDKRIAETFATEPTASTENSRRPTDPTHARHRTHNPQTTGRHRDQQAA